MTNWEISLRQWHGKIALILGLALAGGASADDKKIVDFNGYMRAGMAQKDESGRAGCFQLAGTAAKYRLGNECDFYGEYMLGKDAFKAANGTILRANMMFNAVGGLIGGGTLNNSHYDINQMYLEARDMPGLGTAKIWAGRRFYKRRMVHITDFFYNSPSGTGFGIEDYTVMDTAKLSYAYMDNNGADDPVGATRHNIQLNDIPLYAGGTLDIAVNHVTDSTNHKPKGNTHSGSNYLVEWAHKLNNTYTNRLSFQSGRGAATDANFGAAGNLLAGKETRRWMLMDYVDFQLTPNFGGQLLALYETRKDPALQLNQTWSSVGGRLSYAFTNHFKLLGELGHDRVKPDGDRARNLTKFTIAPTLALERGFWSRPELRFYYTYAKWDKAAQSAAASGSPLAANGIYGTATNGYNFGIQLETWW